MKQKIIRVCLICWFGISLLSMQAQETTLTAGGEATGSGGSVSYSIGQLFYMTKTGTTGSVSEGVQQPIEIASELPDDWVVNPANFEFDGEVVAQVFIDGTPAGAGVLGAFVGNECRGVNDNPLYGPTSKLVYNIRVYSNLASGEDISFRFFYPDYNPDPGLFKEGEELPILDIRETVPFVANMTVGNAVEPFLMNAVTTMEFNRAMTSGWNWFSVYLVSEDMTVDNMLASLQPQNGDYIKDRKGTGNSATYYVTNEFSGWFPSLELDPREGYKLKLINAGDLIYEGMPIDMSTAEILVESGWNWIGYPLSFEMPVNEFLTTLDIAVDDYLKNQLVSTIFYDGFGWWGELEMMEPGNGYVMQVANAGSIHEPDQEPFKVSTLKTTTDVDIDISRYSVNVHNFEFSGSATIEVFVDGTNAGATDNILYAFNQDDICVGMNHGIVFPASNKYVYTLMMYSNIEEGDEIHFKFFDKETSQWYRYKETMNFNYDMVIANAYHPFELREAIIDNITVNDIHVYPNPANNFLIIEIKNEDFERLYFYLYDINGKLLKSEKLETNRTLISIEDLLPATYILRIIQNQEEVETQKIIKK